MLWWSLAVMNDTVGACGYVTNIVPETQSAAFVGFPDSADDNCAVDSRSVSAFGHEIDSVAIKSVFITRGAYDTDSKTF